MVRAKFRVDSVEHINNSGYECFVLKFSPVLRTPDDPDSENTKFWNATPTGKIEITTSNKKAVEQFKPGKEYYVDFTPAE